MATFRPPLHGAKKCRVLCILDDYQRTIRKKVPWKEDLKVNEAVALVLGPLAEIESSLLYIEDS